MLSQYSWGQFFVFVLVLLVVYYLVVGFLYYRDDISDLLKGKKPSGRPQLAGAVSGTTAAAPPSLVRPKSAFVATPAATESAATEETETDAEAPEAGAAENLPEATAVVVGGELPDSTATATGRDDSEDYRGAIDARASVAGATDEAIAADESRQEQEDRPNPQLEALIRQKARKMPIENSDEPSNDVHTTNVSTEEASENLIAENNTEGPNIETMRTLVDVSTTGAEIVYQPAVAGSYEPLADFEELVATTADVVPVDMEELFAVETVAAFVAQLQAGEQPQGPAALADTTLGEQWALRTKETSSEIANLFA